MLQAQIEKLENTLSSSKLEWNELSEFYKDIQRFVAEYPDNAEEILPVFYASLKRKEFNPDIAPTAGVTFSELVKVISKEKTLEAYNNMQEAWKSATCLLPPMLERYQDLALPLYEQVKQQSENCQHNDLYNLGRKVILLAEGASDKDAQCIIDDIWQQKSDNEPIVSAVYGKLGEIYKKHPEMSEFIWSKLTDEQMLQKYPSAYYVNLAMFALNNSSKLEKCLQLVEQQIVSENNDDLSLSKAYKVLGETILGHYPEKSVEIISIINKGLENPANTLSSKKNGWRMSGDWEKLRSQVAIGLRTDKTEENPFGWQKVADIPANEVCVLFLGGDGTKTDKAANGYLSSVEDLLEKRGMKDKVKLYGIVYDFGDYMHSGAARLVMMNDYKHRVRLRTAPNVDSINPKYINQLFDKAIKPRIAKDNKRISTEEAIKNMRKLQIVTHCHGGYTYLKLEEKMKQEMNNLGYSQEECKQVFSQMLVLSHAPYCPLGVAEAKMISFASARDDEVNHYNNFEKAVRKLEANGNLKFSYFTPKQGDLILAPDLGKEVEQHNFIGYEVNQKGLTKEGKAVVAMSGNVLVEGIKNALENGNLPDTDMLLSGGDEKYLPLLKMMKDNGREIYQEIVKEARMQRKMQKSSR